MKKILIYLPIIIYLLLGINVKAQDEKINVYLFYGKTCPVCAEEKKFLDILEKEENINVIAKEVWYDEDNEKYLKNILNTLEDNTTSVPITIIGETMINGYSDAIGNKIKRSINYYSNNEYIDMVKEIEQGTYVKKETENNFIKEEKKTDESLSIKFPFINKLNLKKLPLSTGIFLLGFINSIGAKLIIMCIVISYFFLCCKSKKKAALYGIAYIIISNLMFMIIKTANLDTMNPTYISIIIGLVLICYEILSRKTEKENIKIKNIIKMTIILFLLISTFAFIVNDETNYYNYFIKLLEFNNVLGFSKIMSYIIYFAAYTILNMIFYLIIVYIILNANLSKLKTKIYLINYFIIITISLLLIFNVN